MSDSSDFKKLRKKLLDRDISFGEIKKIAKEIKVDHDLAMQLWNSRERNPRLLAVLIFDRKLLNEAMLLELAADLQKADAGDRDLISEWLLANQLMKAKGTVALLNSWERHRLPLLRRLFWYYQARLRWTGNTDHDNTTELLETIEAQLETEVPEVQWAMNFTAAQIGIFVPGLRPRCIELGQRVGLYRDDPVAKNCTPAYLPEFIRIQVGKLESK